MEVPPSGCLPPILVDPVFGDPDLIQRLIERHGPYAPVQRYFGNVAEYEARLSELALDFIDCQMRDVPPMSWRLGPWTPHLENARPVGRVAEEPEP